MKKYFSVSEAAKAVHATSETLRHYDRIGLVKPSKKDEWTRYRYYTEQDIVRLNTVRALQQMDLPLKEIKQVLEYDDLEKIVDYLTQAEKKRMQKLQRSKTAKPKFSWPKRIMKASCPKDKKTVGFFSKRSLRASLCCRKPWKSRRLIRYGIITDIFIKRSTHP